MKLPEDQQNYFGGLYHAKKAKMIKAACQVLRNNESAEDAVQDRFVQMLDIIQNIKEIPTSKQLSYCKATARNSALHILKN